MSLRRIEHVPRERGWRHLAAAAGYSWGGFRFIIHETAFRHEVAAYGAILAAFAAVGASAGEFAVSLILFLVTIAIEAINTAIELLVDRSSPEISEFGRVTKDLGSFAVFCMLAANGVFALYVILNHLA